ncbi:hypothetical protein [Massilia psychrophila]|uniref:Uncharacterized protein n=1 Tax=Massilia psychrophila TaxID=1603353 RepID=A0A2G8SZG7_9BURK|nr:hypothetical protein [Massilia psychrophila]PIL39195.1 hypothetical protein CR103_13995 [Massilia psychrophila]GGE82145.1 hypothetical protein GCM10008020_28840 [Massilia psychrophila]
MTQKPPFADEIRKTGFVLENRIAQQLKSAGWTVISNKYYVDDSEETVREIDLVAYRCTKVQHFDVYTTLIISCKKSDANAWALLAREINLKDPNSDWWPLHAWSNDRALTYKLSEPAKANRYHKRVSELGVKEALNDPSVEVFAYQEMDKVSGRPQNDKPIFSAVTSLMKAQAYELAALPGRKKSPSVYQFNLLSVVDTDLVRLMFSDDEIVASSLETEHYLAGYIVRKRETFSRIRFIRADRFKSVLEDYGRLHTANCTWFAEETDSFYDGLVKDSKRTQVLAEDFKKKVQYDIAVRVARNYSEIGPVTVNWDANGDEVWVGVLFEENDIDKLNSDERLKKTVAKALKDVYRYEGKFTFGEDLPF